MNRELRILRDALKHEQAVARGRIGSIVRDASNINLASAGKRDLLERSAYADIDKGILSLKKFNAIKDESLRKSELESTLKTLREINAKPRAKVGYIKERVGVKGQKNAKSFFDKLISGEAKDLMHQTLNYGDSDSAMDFIMEHKEGTPEVATESVLTVYGEDVFGGI